MANNKIIIVGDEQTGKSTYLDLLQGKIIDDKYVKTERINSISLNYKREDFIVVDRANQPISWAHPTYAYRGVKAIIVMVDGSQPISEKDINLWTQDTLFKMETENPIPIILVASQGDKLSKSKKYEVKKELRTIADEINLDLEKNNARIIGTFITDKTEKSVNESFNAIYQALTSSQTFKIIPDTKISHMHDVSFNFSDPKKKLFVLLDVDKTLKNDTPNDHKVNEPLIKSLIEFQKSAVNSYDVKFFLFTKMLITTVRDELNSRITTRENLIQLLARQGISIEKVVTTLDGLNSGGKHKNKIGYYYDELYAKAYTHCEILSKNYKFKNESISVFDSAWEQLICSQFTDKAEDKTIYDLFLKDYEYLQAYKQLESNQPLNIKRKMCEALLNSDFVKPDETVDIIFFDDEAQNLHEVAELRQEKESKIDKLITIKVDMDEGLTLFLPNESKQIDQKLNRLKNERNFLLSHHTQNRIHEKESLIKKSLIVNTIPLPLNNTLIDKYHKKYEIALSKIDPIDLSNSNQFDNEIAMQEYKEIASTLDNYIKTNLSKNQSIIDLFNDLNSITERAKLRVNLKCVLREEWVECRKIAESILRFSYHTAEYQNEKGKTEQNPLENVSLKQELLEIKLSLIDFKINLEKDKLLGIVEESNNMVLNKDQKNLFLKINSLQNQINSTFKDNLEKQVQHKDLLLNHIKSIESHEELIKTLSIELDSLLFIEINKAINTKTFDKKSFSFWFIPTSSVPPTLEAIRKTTVDTKLTSKQKKDLCLKHLNNKKPDEIKNTKLAKLYVALEKQFKQIEGKEHDSQLSFSIKQQ